MKILIKYLAMELKLGPKIGGHGHVLNLPFREAKNKRGAYSPLTLMPHLLPNNQARHPVPRSRTIKLQLTTPSTTVHLRPRQLPFPSFFLVLLHLYPHVLCCCTPSAASFCYSRSAVDHAVTSKSGPSRDPVHDTLSIPCFGECFPSM